MEQTFNKLLLRTAFACMTCDGDIAKEEVDLIKSLDNHCHLFGDIQINEELEKLLGEINEQGPRFLKNYLQMVRESNVDETKSIILLDVAAKTIRADKIIKYSELKFFKVIKANLNIPDSLILEKVEGIDEVWVAQDIKEYGILYESYFNNIVLPKFDLKTFIPQNEKAN